MVDAQDVTYEALCSAFHSMEFSRFLGEMHDVELDTEVAIFRFAKDRTPRPIREDPEQANVRVWQDAAGLVGVSITWVNLSSGWEHPNRAMLVWRIETEERTEATLRDATQEVVVRVLETFHEILSGDYITAAISEFAPESEAGDPDDPDDMAVPEEVLPYD